VLAEDHIGTRNKVEEAGVDHGLSSAARLFSRLENRDDGSVPVCAVVHEPFQGSAETGDVNVMPAGMHDRYVPALLVDAPGGAGVVQACCLFYGQSVHVRAQQDGPTRTIVEDADHTRYSYAGVNRETQGVKVLCHDPGGPVFLEGELGVRVQVPVQLLNVYAHTAV
jgi:hypothetical protein